MAVHPASALLRYFDYDHLPEGPLRDVSKECADLATKLTAFLPLNAEQTTGLRKLLEAKDCFVRAALDHPGVKPQFRDGGTYTAEEVFG